MSVSSFEGRVMPSLPRTQALQSKTFRVPPLDGSMTWLQMYDWHETHSPNHRVFIFSGQDGLVTEIFWPQFVAAMYVSARLISNQVLSMSGDIEESPVIGVLATSDTISTFTTMLGIMRANYILFPISPRNSPNAIAHLIDKLHIKHLILGRDVSMQTLATAALDILQQEYHYPVVDLPNMASLPTFEELFTPISENELNRIRKEIPLTRVKPNDIQFYLHSSGSTAYPKPIAYTVYGLIQYGIVPWGGDRDLTDKVFSVHVLPLFHGMGMFQMVSTAFCGIVLGCFEPKHPAILPTPENALEGAMRTQCNYIFSVPAMIEAWSQQPSAVHWLSSRNGLMVSGGALQKQIGDKLVAQGVPLMNIYGSTECGVASHYIPKLELDDAWDYFRFSPFIKPYLVPYGENTFELTIGATEYFTPYAVNCKIEGLDACSTSDIMIEHPTKQGYWKVFGRADLQIVHSTGEKTNPTPLESIMNQDPRVTASVMFGNGRFQAGILVEPKQELKFDPSNVERLSEFRNMIWDTVEKINSVAPQHARIFKEMILVAHPSKPFTFTAKNTARQPAILREYALEISALYDSIQESTQPNIPIPKEWDTKSVKQFVGAIVKNVMGNYTLQDQDDIFQHGCDSLQATWIKNSLLRALRDSSELETRDVTRNFVYDYPTIEALTRFVLLTSQNGIIVLDPGVDLKREGMIQMVEKYSMNFPANNSHKKEPSNPQTVLLTGSTGALGCHILAALNSSPDVSRIYALVRSRKGDIFEQQKRAFVKQGICEDILQSEKIVLLPVEFGSERFGIPLDVFETMQESTTHVIANAWPVDFNMGLTAFEPNIKVLRQLADFSLSAGASLVYISSIGVFQNFSSNDALPFLEAPLEPEVATSTGYSQSKWVSEEILRNAFKEAGLNSIIVRLGQVSGNNKSGAWNNKEWLPSMIKSAKDLGCIPDDKRVVSWIPAETAAQAITDFLCVASNPTVSQEPRFAHLMHPRPVSWSTLARLIAMHLSVDLVPYSEWLKRLEEHIYPGSDEDAHNPTPALRLLYFYQSLLDRFDNENCEAFGLPPLSSRNALEWSSTLSDPGLLPVGEENVRHWLEYWGLIET